MARRAGTLTEPTRAWRTYLTPLGAIAVAGLLLLVAYGDFEGALQVMAPAAFVICAVTAAVGATRLWWKRREVRHRAGIYASIDSILTTIARGGDAATAAEIGAASHTMAAAREMVAARPASEEEVIRRALIASGTWMHVRDRVLSARKWERVRALNDLGWIGTADALPVIFPALSDPDGDVAWAALVALGGMREDVPYAVLLELLDDGRFPASRIAQILDASCHPSPLQMLEKYATTSPARVLFWIAYLLGRSEDAAAFPALLRLARHEVPDVRANAAEAIGRLGGPGAYEEVLRLADDDVWYVRLHAYRSLGDLGVTKAAPVLRAAQGDANAWVRRSATDALRLVAEREA